MPELLKPKCPYCQTEMEFKELCDSDECFCESDGWACPHYCYDFPNPAWLEHQKKKREANVNTITACMFNAQGGYDDNDLIKPMWSEE